MQATHEDERRFHLSVQMGGKHVRTHHRYTREQGMEISELVNQSAIQALKSDAIELKDVEMGEEGVIYAPEKRVFTRKFSWFEGLTVVGLAGLMAAAVLVLLMLVVGIGVGVWVVEG